MAAIETLAAKQAHVMWVDDVPSFSEQQIVDCSVVPNFGCMGGDPKNAFTHVKDNGLAKFSDYPYKDKFGACRYKAKHMKAFELEEFKIFEYPLGLDLAKLVCQGAVSSNFFINDCIKNYESGIITDTNGECGCSRTFSSNHAVTIVGFGVDGLAKSCKKYWLIKNSWGSDWGENGFMRVCREDKELSLGTCSIRHEAILPTKGRIVQTETLIDDISNFETSTV